MLNIQFQSHRKHITSSLQSPTIVRCLGKNIFHGENRTFYPMAQQQLESNIAWPKWKHTFLLQQ